MGFHVLLLVLAALLLDTTNSQPLDIVDSCLFTCEYCFKGEVLLNCANDCLTNDMKVINQMWKKVCPYFGDINMMELR